MRKLLYVSINQSLHLNVLIQEDLQNKSSYHYFTKQTHWKTSKITLITDNLF